MRILAISGSLRAASSNGVLVRAAARLAPEGVEVEVYDGLAGLPHFNPDLDLEPAPQPVAAFRARLAACDAVLICSPEYAHGVPGSLKNALDWIVSSGEMVNKPAGLINASSRAVVAQASLIDTVTMLSATVIEDASPVIPLKLTRSPKMMSLPSPPLMVSEPGKVASVWPRIALAKSFGSILLCGLPSESYGLRSLRLTPLLMPIASTLDRPLSSAKPLPALLVVAELVLLPLPSRYETS